MRALRERLRRYLDGSFADVSVDPDGDFRVRPETQVVWVRPVPWGHGRTLARVWSVTNVGVDVDGELTRFLVVENADLEVGGFHLDERGSAVVVTHNLPGEYVNGAGLKLAVEAVADAAESYAGEIRARFGGELFSEA